MPRAYYFCSRASSWSGFSFFSAGMTPPYPVAGDFVGSSTSVSSGFSERSAFSSSLCDMFSLLPLLACATCLPRSAIVKPLATFRSGILGWREEKSASGQAQAHRARVRTGGSPAIRIGVALVPHSSWAFARVGCLPRPASSGVRARNAVSLCSRQRDFLAALAGAREFSPRKLSKE
jgi:hypothetical protein